MQQGATELMQENCMKKNCPHSSDKASPNPLENNQKHDSIYASNVLCSFQLGSYTRISFLQKKSGSGAPYKSGSGPG